jgi:general nucleoside transport system permease protein
MSTAALAGRRSASTQRSRNMGIFFLALAVLIVIFFGRGYEGGAESSFGLNSAETFWQLPQLILPSQATVYVLAVVSAVIGGMQIARGFGDKTFVVLGVAIACFVLAFLVWAAAGKSLNLLGMLESTLLRAVPLTLGALSGILCERAGIINIAIEGMMLTAAFMGSLVGSASGSLIIGTIAGVLGGALLGALLAALSIRYRVDQIIGGTVINIFALGLTSYLSARLFTTYQNLNSPGRFSVIEIPLLSEIPIIGPILFAHNIFVYLMFILIAVVHIGLFRTRWGLRVRAVGEHPKAADTVGIKVLTVRYRNVILGGMVAGLAGAYLTLGSVGRFDENMTAGKGFIALAAMIFGRWNPIGAFGAALVFGFADSLQNKLSILSVPIPSEFLLMAPYLVTILVVAGFVGRARPPAADGLPYVKE